jgi:hypothetical protein
MKDDITSASEGFKDNGKKSIECYKLVYRHFIYNNPSHNHELHILLNKLLDICNKTLEING